MAGFVQIIEFKSSRIDEIRALSDDYVAKREAEAGGPMPVSTMLTADRSRPGTYLQVVEFPSYEEAMENSGRPDTNAFAQSMMALCDGAPRFYDLDVVESWRA